MSNTFTWTKRNFQTSNHYIFQYTWGLYILFCRYSRLFPLDIWKGWHTSACCETKLNLQDRWVGCPSEDFPQRSPPRRRGISERRPECRNVPFSSLDLWCPCSLYDFVEFTSSIKFKVHVQVLINPEEFRSVMTSLWNTSCTWD